MAAFIAVLAAGPLSVAETYRIEGSPDEYRLSWTSVYERAMCPTIENAINDQGRVDAAGHLSRALSALGEIAPFGGRVYLSEAALARLAERPVGVPPACPALRGRLAREYLSWHGINGFRWDDEGGFGSVSASGHDAGSEWRMLLRVNESSVRQAVRNAVRAWDFELGQWGTGRQASVDYAIARSYVVAVAVGLEGALNHFAAQYGLMIRVNRLDRTVDVYGGLEDAH